jgi:hypothetical protein
MLAVASRQPQHEREQRRAVTPVQLGDEYVVAGGGVRIGPAPATAALVGFPAGLPRDCHVRAPIRPGCSISRSPAIVQPFRQKGRLSMSVKFSPQKLNPANVRVRTPA